MAKYGSTAAAVRVQHALTYLVITSLRQLRSSSALSTDLKGGTRRSSFELTVRLLWSPGPDLTRCWVSYLWIQTASQQLPGTASPEPHWSLPRYQWCPICLQQAEVNLSPPRESHHPPRKQALPWYRNEPLHFFYVMVDVVKRTDSACCAKVVSLGSWAVPQDRI